MYKRRAARVRLKAKMKATTNLKRRTPKRPMSKAMIAKKRRKRTQLYK